MTGPTRSDPYDGLLLVDKPAGLTSHDVVDRIRRHFRLRKVGHGGSLDPLATGLLIILLGRGTRLSDLLTGSDKTYEGVMRLGVSTDSHDADGAVVAERDPAGVTQEALEDQMRRHTGDLLQTPPMVSAVKKDGVPLYKLARRGQEVERQPRLIHVYRFSLLAFKPPRARFRLQCTKGTYVRSLCHEIGEALGCGAHLESLRRTRSGAYDVANATPLDDLLRLDTMGLLDRVIPFHQVAAQPRHA